MPPDTPAPDRGTPSTQARPRQGPPAAMLVALTAIPAFSINVFLPSMPGLAAYFGTSGAMVQLAITLYLVMIGVGQLVYGPFSDRYGRRPVLLAGLVVFVLGCALCLAAQTIEQLLVGRMVQAAGGCAGMVLGRAMIRDLHTGGKAASVLGYITMAMAVATMIAPGIGGVIEENAHWRWSFALMTALAALLLLWVWWRAGETLAQRAPLPSPMRMLSLYRQIAGTRRFFFYGGYSICLIGSYYSYVSGAPHVVITLFDQRPTQYAAYYLISGCSYMAGNFFAGRLSERWGIDRMTLVGGAIAMTAGVLLIGLIAAEVRHPLVVFGPIALSFIGSGLSQPSAMTAALDANPRYIGAGAGLLGALQLAAGALASVVIGVTEGPSPLPFALLSGGLLILGYAILLAGRRA